MIAQAVSFCGLRGPSFSFVKEPAWISQLNVKLQPFTAVMLTGARPITEMSGHIAGSENDRGFEWVCIIFPRH
jgi:hypothetical protein